MKRSSVQLAVAGWSRFIRAMAQDPWVRAACVLAAALGLGERFASHAVLGARGWWLLPALVALAMVPARRAADSRTERRFWGWASAAQVCLALAWWIKGWAGASFGGSDALLSLHFLLWMIAAEQRPDHRRSTADRRLDLLWTRPAVLLFVVCLLVYFLGVAYWSGSSPGELTFQSVLVSLTLGLLLTARFCVFAPTTTSRRWRWHFGLLALAHGLGVAGDVAWIRGGAGLDAGPPVLALVSACVLVAAARVKVMRLIGRRPGGRPAGAGLDLSGAHRNTTWIWALTLPFLHVFLHQSGLLPVSTREPRETVVLWSMLLLGGYALLQRYRVEAATIEEWRRRRAMAEELKSSEQDLRILVERNRGRQALETSEQRFSTAFQLSPEAMLITTVNEGRIIDANESFCSLFGMAARDLLGRFSGELGFWPSAHFRREILDKVISRGKLRDMAWTWRAGSGEELSLNASFELIQTGQEVFLLSILHDITPDDGDPLEQMDLLNPVAVAVVVLNDEGKVELWNAAAERVFGWSAKEVEGRAVEALGLGALMRPRESSGPLLTRLRATAREGEPLRLSCRVSALLGGGRLAFLAPLSHGGSRLSARRVR